MRSVPPIVLVFGIELFVLFIYYLSNVACVYRLSIAPSVVFNIYCLKFQLMSLINIFLQLLEGINRYNYGVPGNSLLTFLHCSWIYVHIFISH